MKTQEFLNLLEQHKDKVLVFEYLPKAFVGANYHITEVKHVHIDSVDCGTGTDAWKETLIQLWESPSETDKTDYMTVMKALGILKKVGRIRPYTADAELKIEYGNTWFHTAQLCIQDYSFENKQLVFKLQVEKTDCKAKETCGIAEPAEIKAQKAEPCCSPDGNCC